jgi:cob(I)alamin adenosyltransferase
VVGGKRVAKDSLRVDAYGAIDELNSIVGLARVFNEETAPPAQRHEFLDEVLCQIQDDCSTWAASWPHRRNFSPRACIGWATMK